MREEFGEILEKKIFKNFLVIAFFDSLDIANAISRKV